MNLKKSYDVIIVGGGPAGAATAKESVRQGLKTLIIEKKKLPRNKPCSGMLMYDSVDLVKSAFGDIPLRLLSDPFIFHAIRFLFDSGRHIDIPLNAIIIKRNEFDHWLCNESGAEIEDQAELVALEEKPDRVKVRVNMQSGNEKTLECSVLVGADGAKSTVAHLVKPKRRDQLYFFSVVQDYYDCTCDLEPGYFNFIHSSRLSYYPVIYWKNNRLIVDTNVEPGQRLLPEREKINDLLQERYNLKINKHVYRIGCQWGMPALQNKFYLGTDRVLLTGDAGGFTKMLGEGISAALATGRIAADSAFKGIGERRPPGRIYQKAVQPEVRKTRRDFSLPNQLKHYFAGTRNMPFGQKMKITGDFIQFARGNSAMNKRIRAYQPA